MLGTARLAGIMAAKRTHELIPLCHPLLLSKVKVDCALDEALPGVRVTAEVKVSGQTGVEMEALTAVSVACLTIYDMVKAADQGHADRRRPPAPEERRPLRDLRFRGEAMSLLPVEEALAACSPASPAGRGRDRGDRRLRRPTLAEDVAACATSRPSPPPPWTATPCEAPTHAGARDSGDRHAASPARLLRRGRRRAGGADLHRRAGSRRAPTPS